MAETAFFVDKVDKIHLRWCTPEAEMDLCRHATLSTAHCLKTMLNYNKDDILFETLSGGLHVHAEHGLNNPDLPPRMPASSGLPEIRSRALHIQPKETLRSRDYLLLYDTEEEARKITINRQIFDGINLDPGAVLVTAKGNNCDVVSRFFTPQASIPEDPVTGSAHCTLTPFRASRPGKKALSAVQILGRTGKLTCPDKRDRVIMSGEAKTYSMGTLWTA